MKNKFLIKCFALSIVLTVTCLIISPMAYSNSLFDNEEEQEIKIRFVSTMLSKKITTKVNSGDMVADIDADTSIEIMGGYESETTMDSNIRVGMELIMSTYDNIVNPIYGGGVYMNRLEDSDLAVSTFLVNMSYGANIIISETSKVEILPFLGVGTGSAELDDNAPFNKKSDNGSYYEAGLKCGYYFGMESMTLGLYGGYMYSKQIIKYKSNINDYTLELEFEHSDPFIGLSFGIVY